MVFGFFVDFFSNPFNWVMILLMVLIGVLIGLLWKPKAKNECMKVLPRDKRFIDFKIKHEDAFGFDCENLAGFPPQRFIKLSAGYTGKIGRFLKRTITRFIGKEGTAYTWKTEKGEPIKIKKDEGNPGWIELTNSILVGSLSDALKGLWGEDFYNSVPEARRLKLEESKINVTVDLEEGLTPDQYKPVSEEDLKTEEDRRAAKVWWEGHKAAEKGRISEWIFIFFAGFGGGVLLCKLLGWM